MLSHTIFLLYTGFILQIPFFCVILLLCQDLVLRLSATLTPFMPNVCEARVRANTRIGIRRLLALWW